MRFYQFKIMQLSNIKRSIVFFVRVPDWCLEERESKETVLYPQGATLPHKGYYLVMNVSIIWNFHEFYLVDKAEKRVYLPVVWFLEPELSLSTFV